MPYQKRYNNTVPKLEIDTDNLHNEYEYESQQSHRPQISKNKPKTWKT